MGARVVATVTLADQIMGGVVDDADAQPRVLLEHLQQLLRLGAVRKVVFYTGSLDVGERERARLFGSVVDKGHDVEEVVEALEPFRTAPPASHTSPAARPRPRASGARLSRVSPEDEVLTDSALSTRSSRR